MKNKRWVFVLMILLLALTAACGGGNTTTPAENSQPAEDANSPAVEAETPIKEPPAATDTEFDFPLPDDVKAKSVIDLGDGAINFQTELSLADAITFYRFAFSELGYVERELLTSYEDTAFSVVFDGHPSGKAIVVQGVDLGESVNINLRFEDL